MIRGTGIDSTVKLYLKGNGADGSTKFYDDSQNHRAVTANGNAQISTAQSKFGGSSIYLDGDGDSVSVADSDDWYFNTDWSISFWLYYPSSGLPTNYGLFDQYNTQNFRMQARYNPVAESLNWYITTDGNNNITATGEVALNKDAWNWICFSGSGGSLNDMNMYANGVAASMSYTGTSTLTVNIPAPLHIGRGGTVSGAYIYAVGYIDDFIITKGSKVDGTTVPTRQRG